MNIERLEPEELELIEGFSESLHKMSEAEFIQSLKNLHRLLNHAHYLESENQSLKSQLTFCRINNELLKSQIQKESIKVLTS